MKHLLILTLFISNYCFAQTYEVIKITDEGAMLNGGAKATFSNGMSRTGYSFFIPQNTVKLFCTVTVSEEHKPPAMDLAFQVAQQLPGYAGMSFNALSAIAPQITAPQPQQGAVNFYQFPNNQCTQLFVSKSASQCNALYGRNNTTGGTYELAWQPLQSGYLYLGFMNPATFSAVYFNLEVAAIVLKP